MNENKKYYDDFAAGYENERDHGYHALIDDLEISIVSPLAKSKDILEVGCGTGLLMDKLKHDAKSIKGVDISPGMLQKAKLRNLDVTEAGAESLPFDDNSFDVVYSFKVLAHVREIKTAMNEMQRVLKPGGFMITEFYNALSLRHLARVAGGAKKISTTRTEDDVFTRWDTPRQIKAYLPKEVTFIEWNGVRVFTPIASMYNLPILKELLIPAEKWALKSPFANFGGFLVATSQKR